MEKFKLTPISLEWYGDHDGYVWVNILFDNGSTVSIYPPNKAVIPITGVKPPIKTMKETE